jgi:hypothetical protein
LGLDSEEASSSPKEDGLDELNEVNEAIMLASPMNPFLLYLLYGRYPAGYAFQNAG